MVGNIAVIGWGSLIWNPGVGEKKLNIKGSWRCDGPKLPVQFARISGTKKDCLTLVLLDEAAPMTTYWAIHESDDPSIARKNLGRREGRKKNPESAVDDVLSNGIANTKNSETIQAWLKEKNLQQAIWTGLGGNFSEELKVPFSEQEALKYLQRLTASNSFDSAKTYITRTPPQIRNEFFERIISELAWKPEDRAYFDQFLERECR